MQPDKDKPPTFSVVMPVYNHAGYVVQAVRSVMDQSLADWRLIIVDDGSTDGSGEIVDDLAGRHEHITAIHQPNAGPAAARNAALKLARGRWLTYIDSDDIWFPDTLANYAAYIRAHPEAKFIYGYRHRLEPGGATTELPGEFQHQATGTAELFERMYLSHLCVCYRRELLAEAGTYDQNLRSCEDYELYLRISLHCRFEPLGLPTGLRRRHDRNISRQTGYSRMLEAELLRRFVEQQGGAAVLQPDRVARRLGRLYYAAGRQYFKARCYRQAVAAMKTAHRYRRTLKGIAISLLSRCLLPVGRTDGRQMPEL
ncbi:MAG: glycosyltransferase [Planctomycetota bacterium]|nr:glycosyltransferase [Planctomycetota bacterium]